MTWASLSDASWVLVMARSCAESLSKPSTLLYLQFGPSGGGMSHKQFTDEFKIEAVRQVTERRTSSTTRCALMSPSARRRRKHICRAWLCNDPAESAHFKPLMQMPQRVFSSPVPDAVAGSYKSRSSRQSRDWHAAASRIDVDARIAPSKYG